jgi:TetR/AcrR family transcriptional repressor of nem operon
LLAGRQLFAENGLDTPSLDAICARAGYTRGAFYVHFNNRAEFTVAVLEDSVEEFVSGILGGAGGLQEVIEHFVERLKSAPGAPLLPEGLRLHHLLSACARSRRTRESFARANGKAVNQLTQEATLARQAGVLRSDVEPAMLAVLLDALAVGLLALADMGVELPAEAVGNTTFTLVRKPS